MSTPPTLIPLYWAVFAIAFLILVIIALVVIILRDAQRIDEADIEIARLIDARNTLAKNLDHAREAIKNATGFARK